MSNEEIQRIVVKAEDEYERLKDRVHELYDENEKLKSKLYQIEEYARSVGNYMLLDIIEDKATFYLE